ncbi:MAG: hypothetical protein ACLFU0_06030 [Alphaproteobacteria bacterium]
MAFSSWHACFNVPKWRMPASTSSPARPRRPAARRGGGERVGADVAGDEVTVATPRLRDRPHPAVAAAQLQHALAALEGEPLQIAPELGDETGFVADALDDIGAESLPLVVGGNMRFFLIDLAQAFGLDEAADLVARDRVAGPSRRGRSAVAPPFTPSAAKIPTLSKRALPPR